MKKITILLLMVCQMTFGQQFYTEEGLFHYKEIFEVDKTQDEIYASVKKWVAINFKDAQQVVQLDTGKEIICKGNFKTIKKGLSTTVDFTLDISIKENKIKVEMYNISIQDDVYKWTWLTIRPDTYTREMYRDFQMRIINGMTVGKKIAIKKLNNEKSFEEQYAMAVEDLKDTSEKLKSKSLELSKSILSSVKNENDGW